MIPFWGLSTHQTTFVCFHDYINYQYQWSIYRQCTRVNVLKPSGCSNSQIRSSLQFPLKHIHSQMILSTATTNLHPRCIDSSWKKKNVSDTSRKKWHFLYSLKNNIVSMYPFFHVLFYPPDVPSVDVFYVHISMQRWPEKPTAVLRPFRLYGQWLRLSGSRFTRDWRTREGGQGLLSQVIIQLDPSGWRLHKGPFVRPFCSVCPVLHPKGLMLWWKRWRYMWFTLKVTGCDWKAFITKLSYG